MSILYIVATPIGNLEDISLRALRILGEVDFILCEDTRVTKKLLSHYKIDTPTISYHQHSNIKKQDYILSLLKEGKDLALVSDAGTPGISDPGGRLVQAVIDELEGRISIESIPGPSATTAALSISGIPTDKYIFLGFPPHKKGRQKFLEKIVASEYPVVVYESKHRILKLLNELEEINKRNAEKEGKIYEKEKITNNQETITKQYPITKLKIQKGDKQKTKNKKITSVVVCRELSKMHETVYRGSLKNIKEKIKNNKDDQKGEFVVIVGK